MYEDAFLKQTPDLDTGAGAGTSAGAGATDYGSIDCSLTYVSLSLHRMFVCV